jgi:hypothetical protein
MGQKLLVLSEELSTLRYTHGFKDDFQWFISPHLWTDTSADSGASSAATDAAAGIVTMVTGGTDNNEAYLSTTQEIFLIAANKPIEAEVCLQYTEAATNAANVAFMLMNAIGADSIVDDGAGLKTNFSGAAIYKVDGSTVWKCMVSIGTTQTIATSTATAGGSAYQRLRIEIVPVSSTIAEARFFIDNGNGMTPLYDAAQTARPNTPIKISFTYTNATEMSLGVGVKAGTSASQTVLVDYIAGYQGR